MRLVIGGGPRTGKTTLSMTCPHDVWVFHTDSLIAHWDWSASSEKVAALFDREGEWVIEGVATVRALRKWLKNNAEGTPCDRMIWCGEPFLKRNKGQESMAKGCETIWAAVCPLLAKRGVEIITQISGDA